MVLLGIIIYSIFVVLGVLLYFNSKDTSASPNESGKADVESVGKQPVH